MPEHGLTEEVLKQTDVLIFWSHMRQEQFSDEVAKRVCDHVRRRNGTDCTSFRHIFKDYEGTAWNKHDASLETWRK